jgi:hypothetical protein
MLDDDIQEEEEHSTGNQDSTTFIHLQIIHKKLQKKTLPKKKLKSMNSFLREKWKISPTQSHGTLKQQSRGQDSESDSENENEFDLV